jgi:hypothetical protein
MKKISTSKKTKLGLFILFSLGLVFSCTNSDLEPNKNVYVAGYTYPSGVSGGGHTAYWRNGILTQLSDNSGAIDIDVSGSHIYILGNPPNNNIVYWKDTMTTVIPGEINISAEAKSIVVSGSDVYLGGYEQNLLTDSSQAVYWKNEIKTVLATSDYFVTVTGLALLGSDVYASGYFIDRNKNSTAAYWKNGVQTLLPALAVNANIKQASTTGIKISGSDIYVSGETVAKACYWKNGELVNLSTPDGWTSRANAIAISGSDVFVVGTIENFPNNPNSYAVVYWKNGVMTQLSDVCTKASGTSIAVTGNDFYVGGYVTSGTDQKAIIWKNGVATTLGMGEALAMVVK